MAIALVAHNISGATSSGQVAIAGMTSDPATVLTSESATNNFVNLQPNSSVAAGDSISIVGINQTSDLHPAA